MFAPKLIIAIIIAFLVSEISSDAKRHSAGASFSFSSINLIYEKDNSDDDFLSLAIGVETFEYFRSRSDRPGISFSSSWNTCLKKFDSRNGNTLRLFTGPGVIVGMGNDFQRSNGYFAGLMVRLGIDCSFDRNIKLRALIKPVIGTHIQVFDEYVSMKYYKQGILGTIIPEISISYCF